MRRHVLKSVGMGLQGLQLFGLFYVLFHGVRALLGPPEDLKGSPPEADHLELLSCDLYSEYLHVDVVGTRRLHVW